MVFPPLEQQVIRRTAQTIPKVTQAGTGGAVSYPDGTYSPNADTDRYALYAIAAFADEIQPWGWNVRLRDLQLRQFLPTQPLLLSAISTVAARNAAFSWKFDGGPRQVDRAQKLLQQANLGGGWRSLAIRLSIDLDTQDNGAFVEVVRQRDSADAPVIGLLNLDAGRCWRTGDPRNPVLYTAANGDFHLLPWYRVLVFEEMPSGIERLRGLQYSAMTRLLQASQIYRDMQQYVREKVGGGANASSMSFVTGVASNEIEDALKDMRDQAGNQGRYRYMGHLLVPGIKPGQPVDIATLDFKSLPDGFDAEGEFNRYIDTLAMALLIDRQDLAPLTGGNIGSGAQSEVLAQKTRGKGPGLWMKMIEDKFNFYDVFGVGVSFSFDEQDVQQEKAEAEALKIRSEVYKLWYDIGMPGTVIWQYMADNGDLPEEYLELIGAADVTDDVTATDAEPVANQEVVDAEAAAATPEAQQAAVADTLLIAARAMPASVRKSPQHIAMDKTEEESRAAFKDALESVRGEFRKAVESRVPREAPVVTEVKAMTTATQQAVADQVRESTDAIKATVAGLTETVSAAVSAAAADNARTMERAAARMALATENATRKRKTKRTPVRDERGIITSVIEEEV